jgi:cell shape-determining protein MreC
MRNAHTRGSEVQRLRKENQALKALLGEPVLEKELRKRSAFGRS